jgi:hypothetical protein
VSSFVVIKCGETGADVSAVVSDVWCSVAPIAWCEVEQTQTVQRGGKGIFEFLDGSGILNELNPAKANRRGKNRIEYLGSRPSGPDAPRP